MRCVEVESEVQILCPLSFTSFWDN